MYPQSFMEKDFNYKLRKYYARPLVVNIQTFYEYSCLLRLLREVNIPNDGLVSTKWVATNLINFLWIILFFFAVLYFNSLPNSDSRINHLYIWRSFGFLEVPKIASLSHLFYFQYCIEISSNIMRLFFPDSFLLLSMVSWFSVHIENIPSTSIPIYGALSLFLPDWFIYRISTEPTPLT